MNRYLVIGHRTLGGPHLFDHLERLRSDDPSCRFHVVVPQYAPPEMMWADGTTHDIAQQRLEKMLATMSDALRDTIDREGTEAFDGIILSTLPHGISHWLSLGVPRRVEKHFPTLPLTHLVAEQTVDH